MRTTETYTALAQQILQLVGGSANVSTLTHCQTRLRFVLNDKTKADTAALKKLDGVLGVVDGVQYQIIIGNDVQKVFDPLASLLPQSVAKSAAPAEIPEKKKLSAVILDFIVGVFQPLIPAVAGAGILKALLTLLTMAGVMSSSDTLYKLFFYGADAAIYFLPLMISVTAATKLGCNKLVALALAGTMVLPNMTNMISEGATIFGFQIQSIGYNGQVFPAILMVLVLALLEKNLNKICPSAIKVFFVPMVCYIVMVPLTFLVIGPLGYNVGAAFTNFLVAVYDTIGWVAVALLSAALPLMIVTGMHKPLVPYIVAAVTSMGYEIMYATASLAHNIAESGACFAVALRTKDEKLRGVAISGGVSALFGITEPAVYGVTIQRKKVLACVSGSAALAGAFFGILAVKCFTIANPGLASMAIYVDPDNAMNIIWAFVGFAIALVASFVSTFIVYRDDPSIEVKENDFV